ncbi:MAG: fibronectin type III domain-containing protein, partial [Chloroflexi bacterium]|nr:fibronectin type III domain-containing protein [Chloroflexota bacterium]
ISVLILRCCFLASLSLFSLSLQAQNAPPAPTGVSTSNVTNDSITLNWTSSSGATSYEIRYAGTSTFTAWSDVGNVTSYTLTGLVANQEHVMNLRAKNANGVSSLVIARATTLDGTNKAPPAPTDVSISDTTHNSITLTWTKSAGATSYEVYGGVLLIWIDVGDVASYTFTGLAANTEYVIFRVRAKNAYGTSPGVIPSGTFLTLPAPPAADRGRPPAKSKREPKATPIPATPTPIPQTLRHLPPEIQVNNWVDGAQGRRVGAAGVGRADLIAQGLLDAIDIWSNVTPGVEVCFAQHGRVVFLDAAYAPRKLSDLPSYQRDGMTCATIDRAGTVVLLRDDSPPQSPSGAAAQSQAEPGYGQSLSDCEVRPWADLNFRQSPPGGRVLSVTASRDWLPAKEKRYGYFKVSIWGVEGWISGDYVYSRGDCGA